MGFLRSSNALELRDAIISVQIARQCVLKSNGSVRKESVQDDVIRGTFKVSLTLSGRSPEPTPTKPNDLLGCCSKPRLSNRPQMPPPSSHVGSGGSYSFLAGYLILVLSQWVLHPPGGGCWRGSREGKKAPVRGSRRSQDRFLRQKIERFFWRDFSGEELLPENSFLGPKIRSILSNQVIS